QDAYIQANMNKYSSAQEMFEKGFGEYMNIYEPIRVRNYLFRNDGELKFTNVSEAWGFADSSFSNGSAVADLDNDGDLDLVVNNLDGEAFLYQNVTDKKNNYLRVKLEGPGKNKDGIGAKVTVYGDGKQQFFQQKTVRGYLSSNEPVIHFGLGKTEKVDSVKVEWLGGKVNIIKDVKVNQVLPVSYATATQQINATTVLPTLFTANGNLLSQPFTHKENVYDEYEDQVLLPHAFSRSGPFIATGDVNKDGAEDFYIGGAAGQAGALYLQNGDKLVKKDIADFEKDKAFEDIGCSFLDIDTDGDLDLYVVSGGSQFPEGSGMYQDRVYSNDGKGNFTKTAAPVTMSSGSCVIAFDIDGDGDTDIFRGGQVVPHAYPNAPRSYLFINEKGKLVDKTMELAPGLVKPGMVNSAVWADLNGDKKSELIIAGEWMPIKVFDYKNGKLEDASSGYGFAGTEGWWDKLVAGDIDGDGDMDLVAGNLGENYKFQASKEKPFEVFAKDFDGNGTNDIFLAKHLNDIMVPIRGRECTSQQCAIIAKKFPTYLSFAESDLKGILGPDIENALHYKAHLFSSVIFINDKGKFTMKKLPIEVQLSTVNGIIINDFDGDGKKDILIAGNKFDVEVETTPADASPGVFLKGLGDGNFKSYKTFESGFFVPYNVKDIQQIKVKNGWAVLVSSNNDLLRVFTVK
ncbi:MAG: FG-GAP-like repeat-containing protein, partial [Chitinophagaceae bacterium]